MSKGTQRAAVGLPTAYLPSYTARARGQHTFYYWGCRLGGWGVDDLQVINGPTVILNNLEHKRGSNYFR